MINSIQVFDILTYVLFLNAAPGVLRNRFPIMLLPKSQMD